MMILYDEPVEHDRLRRTDMASHKIVDMQAEMSFASPAAINLQSAAIGTEPAAVQPAATFK
jgi:hypothetical protein